ncbi:unnamed protein product [Pleuronectes platessa]|uniref:ATP-dependent RNA helicase HrpA n=1 Tax=Pleuronectes platessa TaxID=8262 RepID=A0A9N7YS18_PLEPL|nr:unnamed protein product [Pleuronectes platessa]
MPNDPHPPPAKKFKPGQKPQLLNQLRQLPNVILIGETGSGKTTQIPQYLYEAGIGRRAWSPSLSLAGSLPSRWQEGWPRRRGLSSASCPYDMMGGELADKG